MRYVNLALILLMRDISVPVKKRFPTLDHVVDSGMMTPNEKKIIDETNSPDRIYWMPIVWSTNVVHRARVEKRIVEDHGVFVEDILKVHCRIRLISSRIANTVKPRITNPCNDKILAIKNFILVPDKKPQIPATESMTSQQQKI
jgi:hypothetical protein